ncbi:MAG: peptide deformylase [Sphaerochaetaceae bacterium]|jgi:peptide deformylase
MLNICTLGDFVLREKGKKVEQFDHELRELVDLMFETMGSADGIGLAAPQIGLSKRIFVVDTRNPKERFVFINPQIIETCEKQVYYEEGCLSIPGMYADVLRAEEVTVLAQDIDGKTFTVKADGLLARVIQHEYDHLNGILFIDRLDKESRDKLVSAYEKLTKTGG